MKDENRAIEEAKSDEVKRHAARTSGLSNNEGEILRAKKTGYLSNDPKLDNR